MASLAGFATTPRTARLEPWRIALGLSAVASGLLGAEALLNSGDTLLPAGLSTSDESQQPLFRASSGVLMVAAALTQVMIALRPAALRPRDVGNSPAQLGFHHLDFYRRAAFWRWLFLGLVVSYLAGLCLGDRPDVHYIFRASLVGWYTIAVAPMGISKAKLDRLRALLRWRWIDGASRALACVCVLIVSAELALRLAIGLGVLQSSAMHHAVSPTGAMAHAKRIALLGDEAILGSAGEPVLAEQLRQRHADWSIDNLANGGNGLTDYRALLESACVTSQPDLVVVCISVASDLRSQPAPEQLFRWESLALCQWSARSLGIPVKSNAAHPTAHVRHVSEPSALVQLTTCLRAGDDASRQSWNVISNQLIDLIDAARRNQLPLLLVLIPAEYQVRAAIRQTLCHRAGCKLSQLDLQLPSRRIGVLAASRSVPLLDLTDSLANAGEIVFENGPQRLNHQGAGIAAGVMEHQISSELGQQD